jgi:pyruvate formate lyase activating enzyme
MFVINDTIKELLSLTDLVLLDIKHINSEKCIELCGKPNEKELEFAKYLSNNNIPIWIRQVIVPGITDNSEDILELKKFISSLKTVKKIELLPYHNMGKFKWEELDQEYELESVPPATQEDIDKVKKILDI